MLKTQTNTLSNNFFLLLRIKNINIFNFLITFKLFILLLNGLNQNQFNQIIFNKLIKINKSYITYSQFKTSIKKNQQKIYFNFKAFNHNFKRKFYMFNFFSKKTNYRSFMFLSGLNKKIFKKTPLSDFKFYSKN